MFTVNETSKMIKIDAICTRQDSRTGSELWGILLRFAFLRKITQFELDAVASSIQFWERLGFVNTQTSKLRDTTYMILDTTAPARAEGGKRRMITTKYTATGTKMDFTKDGKNITRVIHINTKGTQYVKYNSEWVLASALKKYAFQQQAALG